MIRSIQGTQVRGKDVDSRARCAHYNSPSDVVAIRFRCCDLYFPCFRCHEAVADHDVKRYPVTTQQPVVLCGDCGRAFPPGDYVNGLNECPGCGRSFNPGCAEHYHRYFRFPPGE